MTDNPGHYGWNAVDSDGDEISIQNTRDGGLAVVTKSPRKRIAQGAVLSPVVARRMIGAALAILDGDPPEPNPDPAVTFPPSFPFDIWSGKGMAYAHVILSGTAKNGLVVTVSNGRDAPGIRLDYVEAQRFVGAALQLLNGQDPAELKKGSHDGFTFPD